jgi:hypothetical protein
MKIDACLNLYGREGPAPWDEAWGIQLPFDHIVCRDVDGTPHSVREFVWPWTAYSKDQRKLALHFYYWDRQFGPKLQNGLEVSPEREARIQELQFLMTRQIYYGTENAPNTLREKLRTLYYLARFAEARSCTVFDVLQKTPLLDAFGASVPRFLARHWMVWINFLQRLDPATQLGFTLPKLKGWKDLERQAKNERDNWRQHAPLPTRVYAAVINNLSTEFDDIEAHAPRLLAALREALIEHAKDQAIQAPSKLGLALIQKHGLTDYLVRRGFDIERKTLKALSGAVTEIFRVCKLQIHVFSGMRSDEARTLPYHCMVTRKGRHGRTHNLIAGTTTKFNKGRRLRTHWVTTGREGFRAIRLAQRFADIVYESLGIIPSKVDARKDEFPLFPGTGYLPWDNRKKKPQERIQTAKLALSQAKASLHVRLFPIIEEEDIKELEEIDPFRAWRDEPDFGIGKCWPLTTHQLRRSLAVYANASGLVRISSLRRQLQHIAREMSFYYGRGSVFCKDFIANDPDGYKNHVASEWQDGEDEAMMLAFTREVLNSKEPMFGGAGNFYQRQKERGEVMSREEVTKQMKAGLLSYRPGPLGGCTSSGGCDKRKGLTLIDISCATDGCKNLVGKHSKVIKVIQLKRAAMAHIAQGSIEGEIEREELEALERVEREWRRPNRSESLTGGTHG